LDCPKLKEHAFIGIMKPRNCVKRQWNWRWKSNEKKKREKVRKKHGWVSMNWCS